MTTETKKRGAGELKYCLFVHRQDGDCWQAAGARTEQGGGHWQQGDGGRSGPGRHGRRVLHAHAGQLPFA